MSARKRRIKRKIAQLVRMDATRQRMLNDMRNGLVRANQLWAGPMMAIAQSMAPRTRIIAVMHIMASRDKRGDRI